MNKKGGANTMMPRPPVQQHSTQGTKRKSDAGITKGGKKGKKGGANTPIDKMESASPEFDMDSDEEDEDGVKRGGKPETEEEKRKNFLERNRQGE